MKNLVNIFSQEEEFESRFHPVVFGDQSFSPIPTSAVRSFSLRFAFFDDLLYSDPCIFGCTHFYFTTGTWIWFSDLFSRSSKHLSLLMQLEFFCKAYSCGITYFSNFQRSRIFIYIGHQMMIWIFTLLSVMPYHLLPELLLAYAPHLSYTRFGFGIIIRFFQSQDLWVSFVFNFLLFHVPGNSLTKIIFFSRLCIYDSWKISQGKRR